MPANSKEPQAAAAIHLVDEARDVTVKDRRVGFLLSRYRLSMPLAIVVADLAFSDGGVA